MQRLTRRMSVIRSGFVSCKKRTGTLRIWRARGREPIWGSGDGAPAGSRGRAPGQKLKAFYCRREQICHSHLSETEILQLYAEKDGNGVPVIKKRTGTAFRCVPARNEPCIRS